MRAACSKNGRVTLYWFYAEVKQAQAANCGHAFCRMEHFAYKLKPAVQTAAFQSAHSVGYGRD